VKGKTRFAPSPTGYLHEGHLLSALYVWAAAQKWNLAVHLRIEDHDQERARPEHIAAIREDLQWLGFSWQSESIQSDHFERFEDVLKKLQERGLVYPCFCSRKELDAENPKNEFGEVIYQGKCFKRVRSEKNLPHSLRIRIPDKVIQWNDLRLGNFEENPKLQCGDFPIRDRIGQWTYQFAVCIDDIDEQITHVIRGEDIRNSTARQIALMELMGKTEPPQYLHHPLITDPAGKKLSKREKAHSIRQDREAGITPQELLGRVLFKASFLEEPFPIDLNKALDLVCQHL
jgi:glutamyl-tRNA synthetase/glutamyl-Q tRNA(Asp) synthetase